MSNVSKINSSFKISTLFVPINNKTVPKISNVFDFLMNSLLANLDSGQPFLAGKVSRGSVYLQGSDFGVEGKLTSVNGNLITIYDGYCTVGFG